MNKFKLVMLTASIMFAMVFTLSSCSGDDGKDGTNGTNGTDGSVVTIGENGNWFIDGKDTDVKAKGEDGTDGTPGAAPCTISGNTITCGGQTLTVEKGCTFDQDAEGKGPIIITCSNKETTIPLCDGESYSTSKKVCDSKGELYAIVKIGEQWWMAEDLKSGTADKFTWVQATAKGVCPNGWSLPSKEDFEELIEASYDFDGWKESGVAKRWWSSTGEADGDDDSAYILLINTSGNASIPDIGGEKIYSYSVRCIRD